MFDHLIVPVDGSSASLSAVPVAARLAAAVDGKLEVMSVVDRVGDVAGMQSDLDEMIASVGPLDVEPEAVVDASHTVSGAIARRVESIDGAMVLMSSHGHGRSAALLGNTVDELLRSTFGPVIVLGPRVRPDSGRLGGNYIVPLDGSKRADDVLPIVAAWSVEFRGTPWLIEAVDEAPPDSNDVSESSYVRTRARRLEQRIGREAEFEVLHGSHPARLITDFAEQNDGSFIFMVTHGRSGLDRLRLGSVAADVIRHAHCPVVVFRPPELAADRQPTVSATTSS
jgi:nucleotide-binding universal stress UspA family protein